MRHCVLLSVVAGLSALVQSGPAQTFGARTFASLPKTYISAMARDAGGSLYVAGWISSTGLPVTPGAFQREYHPGVCGTWQFEFPCTDAFAAKFDPAGRLVFATYLGGGRDDGATGVAVDAGGNVYIAGYTYSPDFPVTKIAFPAASPAGPS